MQAALSLPILSLLCLGDAIFFTSFVCMPTILAGLHKAMSRGGTPSKKGGEKAKGTAAKGAKGEAPAAGKAGSTPAKASKPLAGPSEVAPQGQS